MKQPRCGIDTTIFLLLFLLLFVPSLISAQEFPTKPINITVTNNPGTVPDNIIRMLASKAEKYIGQPFVITNNGAGAGVVALGILAKEKPDGYHLAAHTTLSFTWILHLRSVTYKADNFVPILHYGVGKSGLVVMADAPFKTLIEFVEHARKNPGKVTYSCAGFGTPPNAVMEYIASQEGTRWTCIPYGGDGDALMGLLGGHVTAMSGPQTWIPYVKEGKVRLLTTYNEKRMKIFPEVPTIRELGYDFASDSFYMLSAPRGTPPSIVKKLDDAFRKAMDDPEFIQFMDKIQVEIVYRNSEDLKRYIEETSILYKNRITELKIPMATEKKQ